MPEDPRRQPLPELQLEDNEAIEPDSNPDSKMSELMERERVRAAILGFPAQQQQIIQLRFLENWSHEEVAQVLGKSADATRSLQYRALGSLRCMLKEEESKAEYHCWQIFNFVLYLIQFSTPNMVGNDGYYHFKLANLMRVGGFKP